MKDKFNYTAKDGEGKEVKGSVKAHSHEEAFYIAKDKSLTDITVRRHFEVDELY